MKRLFPILLFITQISYAQPGGGGGLLIKNIYAANGSNINLLTDPGLRVRSFVMRNGKMIQETFIWDELKKNNGKYRIARGYYGFGLPPTSNLSEKYAWNEQVTQRLMITYRKTFMLIDFKNLMGANAGGYVDQMDSLVLMNGYFIADRNHCRDYQKRIKLTESCRQYLKNGITAFSLEPLQKEGLLVFDKKIDLAFLDKKQLGTDYHYNLALYHFRENEYDKALEELNISIQKNNGTNTCETWLLQCDIYTQTRQFDEAIKSINQAMDCKRDQWAENPYADNLLTRAALFADAGRNGEALSDYNELVAISPEDNRAELYRATFKIDKLKAPQSAIDDLKHYLSTQPDEVKSLQLGYRSDNNAVYYTIGKAAYDAVQFDTAFHYMLRAVELGYDNHTSSWTMVEKLSEMINQHPYTASLYLGRALAHSYRAPYLGWGDSTKICFQNALNDIAKAEQLGLSDYRINMYRANMLNQIKRSEEALKEINIAIQKNSQIIRNYIIRYQIRSTLGQTVWGNKNDPDQLIIEKMKKEWGL